MEGYDRIKEEIEFAVKQLKACGDVYWKNRQRVAALGGAYFASTAESAAPQSKYKHHRYDIPKATKSIRSPNGMGQKVATYYPGNLARSFHVMKFKQAASKVFVGSKLDKRGSRGIFSGSRTDGYYMHWVEEGTKSYKGRRGQSATHFFRNSWSKSQGRIYKIMLSELMRIGAKFEQEHKIQ